VTAIVYLYKIVYLVAVVDTLVPRPAVAESAQDPMSLFIIALQCQIIALEYPAM